MTTVMGAASPCPLDKQLHILASYEGLRRDRVERIVAQGRRNGTGKTVGPVGRVIRDAVLSMVFKRMERRGTEPNSWVYDYDIANQTPARR